MWEYAGKFLRCLFNRPSDLPGEIQIEITNRCNLNCSMCPRHDFEELPLEDMPLELFKLFLQKIPRLKVMTLTGWGEPLFHPHFLEFLDAALERFPEVRLRFTTNGLLLTGKMAEEILKRDIAQINLSLDQPPRTEKDQGHAAQDLVWENLAEFLCLRGKKKTPLLNLQAPLENRENLLGLVEEAQKAGVDRLTLFRLELSLNPRVQRPSYAAEGDIWRLVRSKARKLGLPVFFLNRSPWMKWLSRGGKVCLRLDDYAYLNLKGELTPCCNLRDLSGGNLLETSLEEIYHGEIFRDLRRHLNHPVCRRCDAVFCRYFNE